MDYVICSSLLSSRKPKGKNPAWLGLVVRLKDLCDQRISSCLLMILLSKCLFWSRKKCCWCPLLQHLVATQDKSINCLYVNLCWYLDVSDKPHVSRLYNSVNSRPIVYCNMSNSRLKHLKSENDKFKNISEIISFFSNLRYRAILKKKEGVWFSLFNKFKPLTAITFRFKTDFRLQYTNTEL